MSTATVGEDGFHKIEVTSQSDQIQGNTVTVYYKQEGTVVEGASDVGAQEGSQMSFTTDFENESEITPGFWEWEIIRDVGGTERQVGIEGESDNSGSVRVTDAEQI